jgi:hypothetical protein
MTDPELIAYYTRKVLGSQAEQEDRAREIRRLHETGDALFELARKIDELTASYQQIADARHVTLMARIRASL